MLLRKNIVILFAHYLLPVLLLGLLFWIFDRKTHFDRIRIEAAIIGDRADKLVVYWPNSFGQYSEKMAVAGRFKKGAHSLPLAIRDFSPEYPLRLDPSIQKTQVSLIRLTIGRFGLQRVLGPDELASHLLSHKNTRLEGKAEALVSFPSEIDAQLYLTDLPIPLHGLGRSLAVAAFLCYAALLQVLILRHRRGVHSSPSVSLVIGPLLGSICCWLYQWPMLVTLFFLTMLIYGAWWVILYLTHNRVYWKRLPGPVLTAVTFLLCTAYPFFLLIAPNGAFLEEARIKISRLPGGFAGGDPIKMRESLKEFENTILAHFPYRMDLIRLNANAKLFGLGYSPTARTVLGKNDMFFEGYGERRVEGDTTAHFDNITDYMGLIPFSEEELEAWRICLEERYYWLQERGIDYIFALAPSKAKIYPENLPSRLLKVKLELGRLTRYEQLSQYMKANSTIPFVDLSVSLLREKRRLEEEQTLELFPLYYRTDFHWTYYGAYIAYLAIVDAINTHSARHRLRPLSLEEFTISRRDDWVHFRFMYSLGLDPVKHQNDTYLTFFPKLQTDLYGVADFKNLGINDHSFPDPQYVYYLPNRRIAVKAFENENGKLKAIFITGDSFSEKYQPFFSAHARQTISFRTVYDFLTKPFDEYSPELVVQEVFNMYLLHPPPVNPWPVSQARMRVLAQNGQ